MLDDPGVQIAAIIALATLGLLVWWRRDRRRAQERTERTTITLAPRKRP